MHGIVAVKKFTIHAVGDIVTSHSTISCSDETTQLRTSACLGIQALGLAGASANHVANTIDCIGAPKGSTGTADDFNCLYLFQQVSLALPPHTGTHRCIT